MPGARAMSPTELNDAHDKNAIKKLRLSDGVERPC
jgi:hypothetical protein